MAGAGSLALAQDVSVGITASYTGGTANSSLTVSGFPDIVVTASGSGAATSEEVFFQMRVDDPMILDVSVANLSGSNNYRLAFTTPPQYELILEKVRRKSISLPAYSGEVRVTLVKRGKRGPGQDQALGEASSITWVSPTATSDPWESLFPFIRFNMGVAQNGEPLPTLNIPLMGREQGLQSNWIPPDAPDITYTEIGSSQFEIVAPQVRVLLEYDSINQGYFYLKFMEPGSSTSFVTYHFQFPTWPWYGQTDTRATVTKTVAGGNTYETKITGNTRQWPWTIEDWHKADESVIRTLSGTRGYQNYSGQIPENDSGLYWPASLVWDIIETRESGALISKVRYDYNKWTIGYTIDGTPTYFSKYLPSKITEGYQTAEESYETTIINSPYVPTVSGFVRPTGETQIEDSAAIPVPGPPVWTSLAGKRLFQSWNDEVPTFSDSNLYSSKPQANNAALTEYQFETAAAFADFDWPKRIEQKVGSTVVSLSTITYSETTPTGGEPAVVAAERRDYAADGGAYLTTTTKTYRIDGADPMRRGRLYSVQTPNGSKQSFAYEVGSFTSPSDGTDVRVTVVHGAATGTNWVTALGSRTIDPLYLHANKSTKVVEILKRGFLVKRETHVYTGGSGPSPIFALLSTEEFTYTADGRLKKRTNSNGAFTEATWVGTRKVSEKDETGLETTFQYDAMDRMIESTRPAVGALPAQRQAFEYDVFSRVRKSKIGPAGSEIVTETQYDAGGRVKRKIMPGSLTIDYSYQLGGRQVTEVHNLGTTAEATRITLAYKDGRPRSTTGTAVINEFRLYALENGKLKTTENLGIQNGRRRIVLADLLGRTVETKVNGFGITGQNRPLVTRYTYYPDTGLLHTTYTVEVYLMTEKLISGEEICEYDEFGTKIAVGLNLDGVAGLQDGGSDRLVRTTSVYDYTGGGWWAKTSTKTFHTVGSTAVHESLSYTRLTQFPAGILSQTDSYDFHGNRTSATLSFDPGTKSRAQSTRHADGTTTVQTRVGGILTKEEFFADDPTLTGSTPKQTTTFSYDSQGRLLSATDPRNVVTRHEYYSGTNRIWKTFEGKNAGGSEILVSTLTYDSAGRVHSTTDGVGNTSYTTYTARGEVYEESGAGSYPVRHVYNYYGEQTELWTYRAGGGGTPDKTMWTFDNNTGWLVSKSDAASNNVNYAYSYASGFKNVTRTWKRNVSSTSRYSLLTGELKQVTYSEGTPTVTYTHTRTGLVSTVTDAAGTRDFIYDKEQLVNEAHGLYFNNLVLTNQYEAATNQASHQLKGRYSGYMLGQATSGDLDRELKTDYAYDLFGRLSAVNANYKAQGGRPALAVNGSYGYGTNPSTWEQLTQGSFMFKRQLASQRNMLDSVESQWGATSLTKHAYRFDNAGRTEWMKQEGELFSGSLYPGYGNSTYSRYTYNGRGELTASADYLGSDPAQTTSPLPGRSLAFQYDTAGNRTTASVDSEQVSYTNGAGSPGANELNQVKTRGTLKTRISGTVNESATVTISGATVSRHQRYWDAPAPLSSSGGRAQIAVEGSLSGQTETKQVWAQQKAATETFTYDSDGNLLSDGLWSYQWDAENRLKRMQTTSAALAWGAVNRVLTFAYDYLGRRIQKVVTEGGVTKETRYIYQGWQLVAEIDPATWMVTRSYAWGLDTQSSLSAAGGTGAMVLQTVHTTSTLTAYSVAYDGGGHVVALINRANGQAEAVYEYDPFGQIVQSRGAIAKENPMRYATKYHDQETGLVYYGYRYYDASLGRFINRDPIEEAGGNNLYAFLSNNPVGRNDYLGLYLDEHDRQGVIFSRDFELRVDGELMGYLDSSEFFDFVLQSRELDSRREALFGVSFGEMITDTGQVVAHAPSSGTWHTIGQSFQGFLWDGPKALVNGINQAFWHPIETAKAFNDSLNQAFWHPIETAKGIGDHIAHALKDPKSAGQLQFNIALAFTPASRLGGLRLRAAESAASPYAGIRQASQYLQELGVSRAQRVQILQSFEAGTVNLRAAGSSEFGLRFFDGVNAQARGRFLFETFPASRESLALSSRWNQMTNFTQWQIREGSMLIEGRAAAQGAGLPGGQMQKFVPNLDDLFK